ncbi:MAG TPA: DCC1-like thiol-disulfide oxidoreductase family protein [Gemmatimonadaceae bacterium]|nr:DCC1-like thiol-disulfide oxidoreductase family protein [Gemmatimonadaceae bacterium]
MGDGSALLLYDGTCGFCAESVQFVLGHDRRRRELRFASLQGPTGTDVRGRHPELETVDSVIWYEPGSPGEREVILVRSSAVLRVLRYLGGAWRVLAWLGALVPRPLRDSVYDFVARHRHKLVRGAPVCVVPSEDQRARFID